MTKIFSVIAVLLLLCQGYLIFQKTLNGDEAILAEQVHTLNQFGIVKAPLFTGMGQGWEDRQYHFHKLFIYVGLFTTNIFGFSLLVMRMISLCFFIVFIFALRYYINKTVPSLPGFLALAMILLLINSIFLEYGIIFRPEVMVMTFGFLSFIFLVIEPHVPWKIVLSALCAGTAVFTHLNGISFIFAGAMMLLIRKQYSSFLLFSSIASIMSLLYFTDIHSLNELQAWSTQLLSDPNVQAGAYHWYTPVLKIVDEHMRFFWNTNAIVFSLLIVTSLVVSYSSLRTSMPGFLLYVLLLIIGLGLFSHGKTIKYGLLYFPYFIIIITYSLIHLPELSITKRTFMLITLCAFLIIHLTTDVRAIASYSDIIARNKLKGDTINDYHQNVLTDQSFYLNEYKRYTIHSFMAFELKYSVGLKQKPTTSDLFQFARSQNDTYILVDRQITTTAIIALSSYDRLNVGDTLYDYTVSIKSNDFILFKQIH